MTSREESQHYFKRSNVIYEGLFDGGWSFKFEVPGDDVRVCIRYKYSRVQIHLESPRPDGGLHEFAKIEFTRSDHRDKLIQHILKLIVADCAKIHYTDRYSEDKRGDI